MSDAWRVSFADVEDDKDVKGDEVASPRRGVSSSLGPAVFLRRVSEVQNDKEQGVS